MWLTPQIGIRQEEGKKRAQRVSEDEAGDAGSVPA